MRSIINIILICHILLYVSSCKNEGTVYGRVQSITDTYTKDSVMEKRIDIQRERLLGADILIKNETNRSINVYKDQKPQVQIWLNGTEIKPRIRFSFKKTFWKDSPQAGVILPHDSVWCSWDIGASVIETCKLPNSNTLEYMRSNMKIIIKYWDSNDIENAIEVKTDNAAIAYKEDNPEIIECYD